MATLLLATLIVALLASTAPAYSIEPDASWCTITWDGGAATSSWHDAANWDLDRPPTSDFTDRVCIPASAGEVVYSDWWSRLAGLRSEARLVVEAGRLDFTQLSRPEVASLDLRGGEILAPELVSKGDVIWSGGDLGSSEQYIHVYVGDPVDEVSAASLSILPGHHSHWGSFFVRGTAHVAAEAYVSTDSGGIDADGLITIEGGLYAQTEGYLIGDAVVEAGAEVDNFCICGTLHNKGTFSGVLRPGNDEADFRGLVNEGSATVWGSTGGGMPIENAAGATLVVPDVLYVGGLFSNDGLVHVGTEMSTGELELFGGTAELGDVEIVRGDLVVGYVTATNSVTVNGASVFGQGSVVARGATTLTGNWNLGPEVSFALDGDGVQLADATITGPELWIDNARVAADTTAVLDVENATVTELGLEAGAQLINTDTMLLKAYSQLPGEGTLINDGVMQFDETWGMSDWEPRSHIYGHLANNGTITVPEDGYTNPVSVGTLVNAGRLELDDAAEIHVTGAFEQTSAGAVAVVANGSGYDWRHENPYGDVSSVTAASAVVAGTVEVSGVQGCVAYAPVVSASSVTGVPNLTSDVPECEYGIVADSDGLNLRADDTTPPVVSTFDYGIAAGEWGTATKLDGGGLKPSFPLHPPAVADDGSDRYAHDEMTGVRQVTAWWDRNPTAEPTDVNRLDALRDGEWSLGVETTTDGLWRHIAAQDHAGNWSVRHDGPFGVDLTRPAAPKVNLDHVSDLRHVSGSTFEVTWTAASDADSGLRSPAYTAGFDLDTDREYSSEITTNGRSFRFQPRPGYSACVGVTAHDRAGNTRRDVGCTYAALDDDQFVASPEWTVRKDSAYYYGDYRVTSKQGATLTKNLRVEEPWLVATTCPACGAVDVYFDGELRERISLASKVERKKALLPLKPFARLRGGTIKIRVASSGKPVKIQGLIPQR